MCSKNLVCIEEKLTQKFEIHSTNIIEDQLNKLKNMSKIISEKIKKNIT